MVRLIDADALIATLEDVGQYLKSPAFQLACIAAINEVKNAPTVDAFPVIRCKDCKYCKVYEVFGHTLPLCNRIKTMIADALEEDDYCSRAVRKEE